MAAEAEQDAADFSAAAGDAGWAELQRIFRYRQRRWFCHTAGWRPVPTMHRSGIGRAAVTRTERTAVRSMAACAAAALIVVRAEYVNG